MRSTPSPLVALQHLIDPAGIGGIDGEVGAEFLQPAAAHRIGGGADHELCALELCDLHRHQADAGACALDQHALARLQRAVGDDGIVHGGERDGQGRRFLEIHVGGRAEQPAVIGQRIFGKRLAARAHDLVADLDAFRVGPELGDFAGPFHAEHGADAAGRAMDMALGHAEVGAVQPAGVHLDQDLRALRRRFCDVGDLGALGPVDIGFHETPLLVVGLAAIYSAAWRRAPDSMPSKRSRTIASASRMMRETSSAQLGMSWIRPCTWPADQMPSSESPVA